MLLQIYVNKVFSKSDKNLIITNIKKRKNFSKPLDSFMGGRGIMKKIVHILGCSVIKCAIYTLKNRELFHNTCYFNLVILFIVKLIDSGYCMVENKAKGESYGDSIQKW